MIDISSTLIVTMHKQCGSRAYYDGETLRCGGPQGCGHRLTINGVPPVQSRERPMRTWPRELINRRKARMLR